MLFIPLPVVVAILLLALFVVAIRQHNEDRPVNVPFLALILASVLQSTLIGLRWGYEIQPVRYIIPVVAATIPSLVYESVLQLVGQNRLSLHLRLIIHALFPLLVLILLFVWPAALDIALILSFISYAIAILMAVRTGTDALHLAVFAEAVSAYHAILFAAATLLFSAVLDSFIFLDMEWAQGRNTITIISAGQLMSLAILSVSVAVMGRSHSVVTAEKTDIAEPLYNDETNAQTMKALETLFREKAIYRDCNLTLDRLARKLGIPARQISTAINATTGGNVSQFVNGFRISAACDLLRQTGRPVTEIMFEVGFQTKSNFNREFRRLTDTTPLEWRKNQPSTEKSAR